MKKSIKQLTNGILAIIMVLTLFTGVSFAAAPLSDGHYTINVEALNSTTGAPSMANDSIVKPVKLEVENNKIYVILEMADSMYDLAVENASGGFDLAEEVSENEGAKTITYKFPIKSIDEDVLMETVVAAMGRKVNLKLSFDSATLKNTTTPVATSSPSTGNTATGSSNVPNPNTGDNSLNKLTNVILMALILSAGIYGVGKLREKKTVRNY